MNIYQIVLSRRGLKSAKSMASLYPFRKHITAIDGFDSEYDDVSSLQFTNSVMQSKYGISLTPAEVACFYSHRRVWENFAESAEDWCLIIEDDAIIKCTPEELGDLFRHLPAGIHLFFPYDNTPSGITYKNSDTFVLGKQWGAYAYFIHKSALPVLLAIPCTQTLDDELITRCISGEIEGGFFETSCFETDDTVSFIRTGKQKVIREKMLNTNCWNEASKANLHNLLHLLSEIALAGQCELILEGGTLLGRVRHGSVIQWDDDVDLLIHEAQLDFLLSRFATVSQLKIKRFCEDGGGFFYKIWDVSNEQIDGYEYTWPFVDIWTFSTDGDRAIFNSIGKAGSTIYMDDIYPLAMTDFEGGRFFLPYNYERLLTLQYPLWRSHMRMYPYSHRLEASVRYPLATPIEVDQTGRIVG